MSHRLRQIALTPFTAYVAAVIALGTLALSWSLGQAMSVEPTALMWVFAGCVIVAELFPVNVMLRGREGEIVVSTAFAFAMLVTFGPGAAIPALCVGAVVADLVARKPISRLLFNVAQYSVSLVIAYAVLALTSNLPGPTFDGSELPAILLAGVVFFVVNTGLVATVIALASGIGVWKYFSRDFIMHASTGGLALGLSPIIAIAGQFSIACLPLLGLPLMAVHRGSRQAVQNEHQALHDALTGLPNRVLFRDRVALAIETARRRGTGVVVMLMDLDHFKEINDTLGHHHGDRLLELIGQRLADVLRAGDTVARLGGDEFAICLPAARDTVYATDVAEKCLAALREPFVIDGLDLEVGASVGIACFPEHGDEVDTLVQRADVAMYVAKNRRGGAELYRSEQDRHSVERLALVTELRRAIDNDELVLHYQPKLEVATGRLVGVEALTRWEHPTRGLVMPDEFVPVAEATGLITPMTNHVLRAAVAQIAAWREQGLHLNVAVNLSARSFLDGGFVDEIPDILDDHFVAPSMLGLEITESMIVGDPHRARSVLAELAGMGISLAIDDFGTGYSSLAYLKQLPVHEIKIDKSFVLGMTHDSSDETIVRSIIDLAHNLGLRSVAEGVENEYVLGALAVLGCDQVQGYHVSRPLTGELIGRWALSRDGGRFHPRIVAA